MDKYGVLDKSYHEGRKTKKSLIYRLNRRAKEVITTINEYCSEKPHNVLELGAADGLLLSIIKKSFPLARCVGIEYSTELARANNRSQTTIVQGDVNFLPIPDNSFDIVIAAAVIEHLPEPDRMLRESIRVLRKNGLLILTSPDPFWERVATMVGHLKEEQHHSLMTLNELGSIFKDSGYEIVDQKKFMISPVGLPLENMIENIIRKIGLNFLFANQLIIGRKN